jgi:hypothetical protein
MIAKPIAMSGTLDLNLQLGGVYFSSIFYGEAPELIQLSVLSGTSNIITAVELQKGSSFNKGSIIIGSKAPGGTYQVFNLEDREVIFNESVINDNVEDFS